MKLLSLLLFKNRHLFKLDVDFLFVLNFKRPFSIERIKTARIRFSTPCLKRDSMQES